MQAHHISIARFLWDPAHFAMWVVLLRVAIEAKSKCKSGCSIALAPKVVRSRISAGPHAAVGVL